MDVVVAGWCQSNVAKDEVVPCVRPSGRAGRRQEVRTFLTHSSGLIQDTARSAQRVQKILEDAGIKLDSVA
jgi:hypothetical protein